jgi:rhodanese-related sulfurtransferase
MQEAEIMLVAIAIGALAAVLLWVVLQRQRRAKDRKLLQAHTILAEELNRLLATEPKPRVFDVRQPLDLLAYSEIIPGAVRIAPKEILANPALIPKDEETVVYCTCPDDKTAREIVGRALGLGFLRMRILKDGLGGWKAMGYPVEPYRTVFHLDTPL